MKLAQQEESSDVDHHFINMTLQQGGSVNPNSRTEGWIDACMPSMLDPTQMQDYLKTFDGTFNISPVLSGNGNVIGTHLEYTQLLEPQGAFFTLPMSWTACAYSHPHTQCS